jgi:hypothetical protein
VPIMFVVVAPPTAIAKTPVATVCATEPAVCPATQVQVATATMIAREAWLVSMVLVAVVMPAPPTAPATTPVATVCATGPAVCPATQVQVATATMIAREAWLVSMVLVAVVMPAPPTALAPTPVATVCAMGPAARPAAMGRVAAVTVIAQVP